MIGCFVSRAYKLTSTQRVNRWCTERREKKRRRRGIIISIDVEALFDC